MFTIDEKLKVLRPVLGSRKVQQLRQIYLFEDDSGADSLTESTINTAGRLILPINPGTFSISFQLPNPSVYLGGDSVLQIDNDQDGSLNEDPEGDTEITCATNENDTDCDGKINEDSDTDPVILWKLSDGGGGSLIPLKGCINGNLGITEKSKICESD